MHRGKEKVWLMNGNNGKKRKNDRNCELETGDLEHPHPPCEYKMKEQRDKKGNETHTAVVPSLFVDINFSRGCSAYFFIIESVVTVRAAPTAEHASI